VSGGCEVSADQTPAIDWDTHEPTGAVHRAAIVLSSADSVDATCYGWVPQAHEALSVALNVPQMASAIIDHLNTDTLSDDSETLVCGGCGHVLVTGDPDDDRDPQAEHATHHAALLRAAILGADS
jgi:formylmethanofuran dehydrogenase subunit B